MNKAEMPDALKIAEEWKDWVPYPDSPKSEWDRFSLALYIMQARRDGVEAGVRAMKEEAAKSAEKQMEGSRKDAWYLGRAQSASDIRSLPIEPIVSRVLGK